MTTNVVQTIIFVACITTNVVLTTISVVKTTTYTTLTTTNVVMTTTSVVRTPTSVDKPTTNVFHEKEFGLFYAILLLEVQFYFLNANILQDYSFNVGMQGPWGEYFSSSFTIN